MFSRKKANEDLPKEMTAVWECTNDGCNGWMRDDFSFESEPSCSLCDSPMARSEKELPVLQDVAQNWNSHKKATS